MYIVFCTLLMQSRKFNIFKCIYVKYIIQENIAEISIDIILLYYNTDNEEQLIRNIHIVLNFYFKCIYLYMNTHTHTHSHTYIYIYMCVYSIHTYIYIYIYICRYARVCACACARARVCVKGKRCSNCLCRHASKIYKSV
jgi:hypothetical protein